MACITDCWYQCYVALLLNRADILGKDPLKATIMYRMSKMVLVRAYLRDYPRDRGVVYVRLYCDIEKHHDLSDLRSGAEYCNFRHSIDLLH